MSMLVETLTPLVSYRALFHEMCPAVFSRPAAPSFQGPSEFVALDRGFLHLLGVGVCRSVSHSLGNLLEEVKAVLEVILGIPFTPMSFSIVHSVPQ